MGAIPGDSCQCEAHRAMRQALRVRSPRPCHDVKPFDFFMKMKLLLSDKDSASSPTVGNPSLAIIRSQFEYIENLRLKE
ncbi:MAG: hypothetical protein ABWY08_12205 [Comamonas sp.]